MTAAELAKAREIDAVLESRFLSSDGVMYDYTGLDGEVLLPTPRECEQSKPNALGWWSPVENGGFFTGMYLCAKCEEYLLEPTPAGIEKIRLLVRGLYKLQDVGDTPGFIARGIGNDGRCHYTASSNDQNFPWFLGLGKYLETSIPDADERRECVDRLRRQGEALAAQEWRIIGDRPNFVRGEWLAGEYPSAVHIATATRVLYQATGDRAWLELHRNLLESKAPDGRRRLDIIEGGPEYMGAWAVWFLVNCQYAVGELIKFETDSDRCGSYRRSLLNAALMTAPLLELHRKFDPAAPRPEFTPDWHLMMPPWRPQQNGKEAQVLAEEQLPVWERACPAIAEEKAYLKPALGAAWMIALSGSPALLAEHRLEIEKLITRYDYRLMYYATFFYAENLIATLRRLESNTQLKEDSI